MVAFLVGVKFIGKFGAKNILDEKYIKKCIEKN